MFPVPLDALSMPHKRNHQHGSVKELNGTWERVLAAEREVFYVAATKNGSCLKPLTCRISLFVCLLATGLERRQEPKEQERNRG